MTERKLLSVERFDIDGTSAVRIESTWNRRAAIVFDHGEVGELCAKLARLFPEHFQVREVDFYGQVEMPCADLRQAGKVDL